MIQFILMLIGLAFSNNNANTATNNNNDQGQTTVQTASDPWEGLDPGDTGGDTIPVLPPKK